MVWNIQDELVRMAPGGQINHLLSKLGFEGSITPTFIEKAQWFRANSEFYSYLFDVQVSRHEDERRPDQSIEKSSKVAHLVAKAAVAPTLSVPPELQVKKWNEKRSLVAGLGVPTPLLVGESKGLFVEEYWPFSLDDLGPAALGVEKTYEKACQMILAAGFRPDSFVSGFRSDGHQLAWCEFGSVLGSMNVKSASSYTKELNVAMREFSKLCQRIVS